MLRSRFSFLTLSGTILLASHLNSAAAQTAPTSGAPVAVNDPAAKHARGNHPRDRWQQADLDKDGQLSKAEAQAAGMKHLTDHFDAIDTSKDGKISEAEVRASMQSKRADKGAQGAQTHNKDSHKALAAQTGQTPNSPAHAAGNTPKPAGHGGGMDYKTPEQRQAAMKERLTNADTNKDGGLSKAEAQAGGMNRLVEHFDAIDTNKDGKITPEEMRTAWERRKQ